MKFLSNVELSKVAGGFFSNNPCYKIITCAYGSAGGEAISSSSLCPKLTKTTPNEIATELKDVFEVKEVVKDSQGFVAIFGKNICK